MYIGLDVGGTNTDAVLLNTAYEVVRSCKVPTTHDDVGHGIISALQKLLTEQKPETIHRVCVSSTLALNALLTKRYDRTGLLLVPGPGLTPPPQWQNPLVAILPGAQDHLGKVIAKPEKQQVIKALEGFKQQEIKALGIVTKFSPKNPALEEWLEDIAKDFFATRMTSSFSSAPPSLGAPSSATPSVPLPLVLGSSLSGTLNFPRRVATAWCQAALMNINTRFIGRLDDAMRNQHLTCPLDILKADGGTFAHTIAALNPANSIGSGPAASILGALPQVAPESLASPELSDSSAHFGGSETQTTPHNKDSAVISIGGTTTDIAILANGDPLMLKEGLTIDGHATLVKGMHTKSIALGGDSSLAFEQGTLLIKPERLGPALCLAPEDMANRPPTLTDALRVLRLHELGNMAIARQALGPLAEKASCSVDELALSALQAALETLATTLADFVEELNSQPVYTIREIHYTAPIRPQQIILIGAPAPALAVPLAQALGLPVRAPEEAGIANAIGAALARPTVDAELYADTSTGLMSIAPYGITKQIGERYTMSEAKADLTKALQDALYSAYTQYGAYAEGRSVADTADALHIADIADATGGTIHATTTDGGSTHGDSIRGDSIHDTTPHGTNTLHPKGHHLKVTDDALIHIVFAETFHTLSGYSDRGKIFRLKAQVSPGLISTREEA